jgi:hypothetical protein
MDRALAVAALVALAACTPNFQSQSEVLDLRVLAVAAEPPEAFADLDGGTVQPVTVRVLVADPSPRAPVDATASICFPTDNKLCQLPRLDLPAQERPDPGELSFTVQAPAPLIIGALQDDRLKGLGGVRVQFSTSVQDGDPHGAATAEKVLLYSTQPQALANHSPRIVQLEVTHASGKVDLVPPDGTVLLAGEEVGLRPIVGDGPDGPEEYDTVDLTGHNIHLREQLNYSFFARLPGSFDKDRADEPLPGDPTPPNGIVRFVAPPGTGTLWIVVRDGRGGLSWFVASWNAT